VDTIVILMITAGDIVGLTVTAGKKRKSR